MAVWVRAGTVNVTNGSASVGGSGTGWSALVGPGDALRVGGSDRLYEIASVAGDAALTLTEPYAGSSQSGTSYVIIPYVTGLTTPALVSRYNDLIQRFQDHLEEMHAWLAGTPDGGPADDGFYPVHDWLGVERMIPAPALYTARVITVTLPERPMAGQLLALVPLTERLSIPAGFVRSRGFSRNPPAEDIEIEVYDNETLVGTIVWQASASQPSFPAIGRTTMNVGRRLRLVLADGLQPSTIAEAGLALVLERGP